MSRKKSDSYRRTDYVATNKCTRVRATATLGETTTSCATRRTISRLQRSLLELSRFARSTTRQSSATRRRRETRKIATFARALDQQQLPNWETNLNDHFAQTVDIIKQAAAARFKKVDTTPTQPRISAATTRLIRARRHAQLACICKHRFMPGLARFARSFLERFTTWTNDQDTWYKQAQAMKDACA